MDNLRACAAIFGFGGFLFGAVMMFNGEEGAAGLLVASAIVIAGVVIASALDPAGSPRRPPRDPGKGPAD